MSTWTHVTGVIRYDSNAIDGTAECYKEIRLIEDSFFADAPHGSESPMQYTIIPTFEFKRLEYGGATSGSGLCDIAFGGDFRDFDTDRWQELRDWFNDATKSEGLDVRQAVMLMQGDEYPNTTKEVITFIEE